MLRSIFVVVFGIAVASGSPAGAVTILVNQTDDPFTSDGLCSLREAAFAAAFDLAFDGCPAGAAGEDTVQLFAGTYLLRAPIVLGGIDPFSISGKGAASTSISPEPGSFGRLFSFHDGGAVTLRNLTLRGADNRSPAGTSRGGAIRALDFDLTLEEVAFVDSLANSGGALAFETVAERHDLLVTRCSFSGNRAEEGSTLALGDGTGTVGRFGRGSVASGALGGAIFLDLRGPFSVAKVHDSDFAGNVAAGADVPTIGGGAIFADFRANSSLEMVRTTITGNRAESAGSAAAVAGLSVRIETFSSIRVVDTIFTANDATGPEGSTAAFAASTSGQIELDRVQFLSEDAGEAHRHVAISAQTGAYVSLRNLLIAAGPATGLAISTSGNSSVEAGHLTVTGHGQTGLDLDAGNFTRFVNSIFWQNGQDLADSGSVPPLLVANLIGSEPLFVPGSYELAIASPAVDTGDDTQFTVGFLDTRHRPRRIGAHTDRGALERRGIFGDGFSWGLGSWSDPEGTPHLHPPGEEGGGQW